jgi:hypothetical protein
MLSGVLWRRMLRTPRWNLCVRSWRGHRDPGDTRDFRLLICFCHCFVLTYGVGSEVGSGNTRVTQ